MKTTTTILGISILALAITWTACGPLEQGQGIDEQAFALEQENATEEENPWRTHRYLKAYARRTANFPSYLSLKVEDWGLSWESEASSRFYAHASKLINSKIKVFYDCEIENPKVEDISLLPKSLIGPNKALTYTLEAPACDGYKAATFTVSCSADKTCHTATSGQTKETRPDGMHTFSSYEREGLEASNCYGMINNCTITFDNRVPGVGGVWIKKGKGYGSAQEERRRGAAK